MVKLSCDGFRKLSIWANGKFELTLANVRNAQRSDVTKGAAFNIFSLFWNFLAFWLNQLTEIDQFSVLKQDHLRWR